MKITRTSPITGKTMTLDLNVTREQMKHFYSGNDLVQNIFRNLSPGEREFIKTGILEEEFDSAFTETV